MNRLRGILHRFGGLFGCRRLESEMNEEMRAHLDGLIERNLAAGMSPDEARYAALRTFGGVEQIAERARDERRSPWGEHLWQDLRYAARQWRKTPGFTAVVVVTLGLAIGVNSATFSFLRDFFLRPLVRDAETRVVSLFTRREGSSARDREFRRFSFREFAELRAAPGVLADVAALGFAGGAIGRDDYAQPALFCLVSENYFSLLGVRPFAGRFFSADEARPDAALPVVVVNHAYWQRRGSPSGFVGSELRINGRDYTVVGIAPAGFGGLHAAIAPAAWLPLGAAPLVRSGLWGSGAPNLLEAQAYRLLLIGALRPELPVAATNLQLGLLEARLSALAGTSGADARRLFVAPPSRFDLSNDRPSDERYLPRFALLATAMAASVLLVACLNLANLFLARGIARRREIAIRLALGASRGRVVRQLVVEALLLALGGGALGLALSGWVGALLQQFQSDIFSAASFTYVAHAPIDGSSVVAMSALCLGAMLVFSVVPALRATKLDLVADLKLGRGAPVAGSRPWTRFFAGSHCLVMAQIALAFMLLFGAGLFVRSAWNAMRVDVGFQPRDGLVAGIDYGLGDTPPAEIPRRQQALLARARTLPGATHVALASAVPYNFEGNRREIFSADAGTGGEGRWALTTSVSDDYFRTLGIAVLRGRDFTAEEATQKGGPRVAIIDETLARALFGGSDAIGRRVAFRANAPADRTLEIAGVVRSPRQEVFGENAPMRIYLPLAQAASGNIYLHVKFASGAAPDLMVGALRREQQALDPQNPVVSVRLLRDVVGRHINTSLLHLAALAFGSFGVLSLVLAVVGVYAVKAHAVSRRTHEIGVRLALGARPGDVVSLILKQGAGQAVVGLAAGLGLSLLAGTLLSKMLYRVDPFDRWALIAAALVVGASAVAACLLPARRAARVDPMVALRAE
ncbi:MAG TPA: ADOP family duplicated permease [Opitutaceae bacterium]|nr:ADOP family duplicated permease [Opitutaceae bacterium]